MTRRLGLFALLAATAFLTVTLLAPVASADHAYSHRYVIYGRLVDADGDPIQGATADVRFEHFEYDNPCNPNQPDISTEAFGPTYTRPVTNEFGEFIFCMHTHGMSRTEPGTAFLRATDEQGNLLAESSFELDGYRRVSFVTLRSDDADAGTPGPLAGNYTVAGRLWRDTGQQKIEGITVYGDTVQEEPVNVTLEYNDGKTITVQTTTNGYGDFSVRVPVEARVESGTVTIEAAGETFTGEATEQGATTFTAIYEEPGDPVLGTVLRVLAIGAGAVVLVGAIWFGYRRVSASRAEAEARARSSRKRAQR